MDNLVFSYQELLAEIGAKSLVIQRQTAYIAELEAALQAKHGDIPVPEEVVETTPAPLAIAGNGAKGQK